MYRLSGPLLLLDGMQEAVGHGGDGYQTANRQGEELCDGAGPRILLETIEDLPNDVFLGEDS